MSDDVNCETTSDKAKKEQDQYASPFGNWEDFKRQNDAKQSQAAAASSSASPPPTSSASASAPNCIFDWSPHTDSNDFMRKLNFWIWECQQWKYFHAQYPALLAQSAATGTQSAFSANPPNGNLNRVQTQANANTGPGTVYVIPAIWKRIAAEVLDCLLLLILKILLLSIFLTEYVQFRNLEEIKALLLEDDNMKSFNLMLFEHSAEMLAIAIIHRIIVCIYETYSLYMYPNPNVGGATMGKMLLGLKVVRCNSITDLGNGRIRVMPAGNIGFTNSLVRAVIKNSSIVFFVPSCFTIFGSQYNRTAYDFMCSCIVVENVPTR